MTKQASGLWRSDLVQSLAAVVLRLGAAAANYGLFALAARSVGPDGFGVFSTYFSAAMLAGLLGSFGQQIFLVKEVPRARERGDVQGEFGLYVYALIVTLVAATAAGAAVIAILRVFQWEGSSGLLVAGFVLTWAFAASQTTMGALRIQERTLAAMASRDLAWRLLAIAVLAILVARASVALDAGDAFSVVAWTLPPMLALQSAWVVRHLMHRFRGVSPSFHWRSWLETSAGMAVVSLVSSADLYAYTIVLGRLLSATETGAFFAALKTVELLNLFLMAVTLVVAPELSRLAARGDAVALQRKCNAALVLQGVPALLAGILVMALAGVLLGLFAPEYAAYASLLRLLVVGMLVNAFTGATVLLLQLAGGHWLQVGLQSGALLLALGSLPVLVPQIGIQAAGVAFLITKGLWNVAAVVAIRRRFGVDPSIAGLAKASSGGLRGAWTDLRRQLTESGR